MLRKLSLAAVAVVALGAALAPTSASAHWHGGWGHGGGGGWHSGWGGPALLCRWPRLLRLWRLLCAPAGPDPLGTPLADDQPLLLSPTAPFQRYLSPQGTFQAKPRRPPAPGLCIRRGYCAASHNFC